MQSYCTQVHPFKPVSFDWSNCIEFHCQIKSKPHGGDCGYYNEAKKVIFWGPWNRFIVAKVSVDSTPLRTSEPTKADAIIPSKRYVVPSRFAVQTYACLPHCKSPCTEWHNKRHLNLGISPHETEQRLLWSKHNTTRLSETQGATLPTRLLATKADATINLWLSAPQ